MGPGLILLKVLLALMGSALVAGAERRLKTPGSRHGGFCPETEDIASEGVLTGVRLCPGPLPTPRSPSPPDHSLIPTHRPDAHFLAQEKFECRFTNGTAGEVRFFYREIWDRQECWRFDSHLGRFVALSPLCENYVERFNRDPHELARRVAQVDSFCRHNHRIDEGFLNSWTIQPTVRISHTKTEPLGHHSLLICTAAGYYPSEINIKWLKNGQKQTEGVGYSEKFQNGDWTFQDQVMLETVPEQGDVYACQVEHSSVTEPITVQWEPRSSHSAKTKVLTGAVGVVLGVAFGAVGLCLYLRARNGGLEAFASKVGNGTSPVTPDISFQF
uniref:H-2 class II histocompatibility antigen, E-S beta chain-like n=1 Tax=Euleptes europaea TaxID=460621 RepID=UPI00253FBA98|nr:H-2 class II histocompatibility antigen, E-S beta chain-like [Euleptes europaea]